MGDLFTSRAVFCVCMSLAAMLPSAHAGAAERLPDTEITQFRGTAAWLIDPVRRYDHGILGDAVEAGGFQIQFGGRLMEYRLGGDAVFEDRRVRLADLTGDGVPEAIIIKTYLARGAAIAVYKLGAKGIEPLAETQPIGKPHRWLNPVGIIANPGEKPVIAAVVTPHLSGSLRTYRLEGKSLKQISVLEGYTNHIIDTSNLDLGRVADANGDGRDDIILPDIERRHLAVIDVKNGKLSLKIKRPAGGQIIALDRVNNGTARIRLANGRRVAMKLR